MLNRIPLELLQIIRLVQRIHRELLPRQRLAATSVKSNSPGIAVNYTFCTAKSSGITAPTMFGSSIC